jgi:hypothetical protein
MFTELAVSIEKVIVPVTLLPEIIPNDVPLKIILYADGSFQEYLKALEDDP